MEEKRHPPDYPTPLLASLTCPTVTGRLVSTRFCRGQRYQDNEQWSPIGQCPWPHDTCRRRHGGRGGQRRGELRAGGRHKGANRQRSRRWRIHEGRVSA